MGWNNPPLVGATFTNPILASTTWAARGTPGTGALAFISDAGAGGSLWRYNGTRWKPFNGIAILATLDTPSALIGNSETVVFQYQMPAAFWQLTDRLSLRFTSIKSGTTDTGTFRVRLGTTGTTGDTQIAGFTNLAAANRQSSGILEFRLETATTTQEIGNTQAPFGYSGSVSNSAFPAATTISNVSNSLFVSLTVISSSTNDTIQVPDAQLELRCSAN